MVAEGPGGAQGPAGGQGGLGGVKGVGGADPVASAQAGPPDVAERAGVHRVEREQRRFEGRVAGGARLAQGRPQGDEARLLVEAQGAAVLPLQVRLAQGVQRREEGDAGAGGLRLNDDVGDVLVEDGLDVCGGPDLGGAALGELLGAAEGGLAPVG